MLYAIFLLAILFRLYNVNWDQGYHMHPDERAIVLTVTKLSFPSSFSEFLASDSPWNPKFFAYGSLPFYLLYFAGSIMGISNPLLNEYEGINIVGRYLSAFFDLGTLLFIYLIAGRILHKKAALLASFFYAISVLPIQLSHFYAVDTPLTFFITGTLYFLLRYYESLAKRYALLIGFFFGAALATKISASVLLVSIGTALIADYMLLFIRQPHKPNHYLPHLPVFLRRFFTHGLIIAATTILTLLFFEPYALLDIQTFIEQTVEQSHMTDSAFTFPYTLQYVGKLPYFYELRNVLLFGQGPLLAFFTFSGILLLTIHAMIKSKTGEWAKEFILMVYFWVYFLIVGNFAIGFMRYMLPLYPLFSIGGAFFIMQTVIMFPMLKRKVIALPLSVLLFVAFLLWPMSFLSIYTKPNTRIIATQWIHQYIPEGATLAIEHWDDALPLTEQQRYTILTLPLYDPDTADKWQRINSQIDQTEYIILASNRLYTPLMKLTDCPRLPIDRCYKQTAQYYQQLFDGTLGFQKVADIFRYPTIPFTSITIPDQSADESFTVYDHPRIMIFRKMPVTQ